MASFTGVGDNTTLQMRARGDKVAIAISGTYNMTIALQKEVGSPGSGAWSTIRSYSTANATVADVYETLGENELLRLIVTVDTSGTATATLTDGADITHVSHTLYDGVGRKIVEYSQAGVTFYDEDGNAILAVTADGANVYGGVNPGSPVAITANTTLTKASHAGRLLVFNDADGATLTLPAATGSGDRYRFYVGVTVTSVSDKIAVANASDIMAGVIFGAQDGGDTVVGWETAADSDTITLNGSTTGGLKGDYIELEDAKANLWRVTGHIAQTGTEATPFSAAVS